VVARDHRRPRQGRPCVYQPLKEGYRSWGGGIGLSAGLTGLPLDAAYEYINWYLSGWVGGFLMRQGYYSAVPETSKQFMSEDEWGFWFEGKPPRRHRQPATAGDRKGRCRARRRAFFDRMGASPAGTPSWTRTSTWSASGTSSSPPDRGRPSGGQLRGPPDFPEDTRPNAPQCATTCSDSWLWPLRWRSS
jgi:hypothetical protein